MNNVLEAIEMAFEQGLSLAGDSHDPEEKHKEGWMHCPCVVAARVRSLKRQQDSILKTLRGAR